MIFMRTRHLNQYSTKSITVRTWSIYIVRQNAQPASSEVKHPVAINVGVTGKGGAI